MKLSFLPSSIRHYGQVLCAALALFACTSVVRAEDPPKFGDPDVTAFVKLYSDFTDQFVEATKASKTGDNSKLQAVTDKLQDITTKAAAVGDKIKPEEAQKYADFMMKCAKRIEDAAK